MIPDAKDLAKRLLNQQIERSEIYTNSNKFYQKYLARYIDMRVEEDLSWGRFYVSNHTENCGDAYHPGIFLKKDLMLYQDTLNNLAKDLRHRGFKVKIEEVEPGRSYSYVVNIEW